jgi:hypothetical protein
LSEKKKAGLLTTEEDAELAGILELDRIFTLLNAKIIVSMNLPIPPACWWSLPLHPQTTARPLRPNGV